MSFPIFDSFARPRAVVIAAYTGDESWRPEASIAELERLAATAGIDVVGRVIQRARSHQPASYIGKGRARTLKQEKSTLAFDTVIADDELAPEQHRYLENVLDVEVLDRTAVILHIFAQHARSREGQLQVELAQYRYRLPRLTGRGVELSRMGAAARGGAGVNVRGPGETKLETDRRRIRRRISELNREIEAVRAQRAHSRRQRRLSGIPVIALAGYTNAGKSTLLNALTGARVLSSDQLFATLDPTTRRVELPTGQEILLTDTVGFIQKLPSDLIAAFRATLEEIVEADLILHVVDASHPQVEEQAEAVEDELEDLGVTDRPRLTVLNKADLVSSERLAQLCDDLDARVAISARAGDGLDRLEDTIATTIAAAFVPVQVQIPYGDAALVGLFRTRGMVDTEQHDAAGTLITGKLPAALLPNFRPYFS
jgi:GTP-binding protein HflX